MVEWHDYFASCTLAIPLRPDCRYALSHALQLHKQARKLTPRSVFCIPMALWTSSAFDMGPRLRCIVGGSLQIAGMC